MDLYSYTLACREGVWDSGCMAPLFLDLDAIW